MTLILKGLVITLFFSFIIGIIALLPDVNDYPLPPEIGTAIAIIVGYVFSWVTIFWCISVLFAYFLLTLGFELIVLTARMIMWIISLVARFVG